MIEKGLFRKDLLFRLGVVVVNIPSLNERKEDIIPIAKHFLFEFNKKFGKEIDGMTPDAEASLTAYHWTGNVRELKNVIERAVLICKGSKITLQDIGLQRSHAYEIPKKIDETSALPSLPNEGIDLVEVLESLERHYINEALKMAQGNESQAARLLNMNHHTFRYRRKKLLST